MIVAITFFVILLGVSESSEPSCQIQHQENRFDCHPEPYSTEEACLSRSCCWKSDGRLPNQPYCYFPNNSTSYDVVQWRETPYGFMATLRRSKASSWPNDVSDLVLKIWFETKSRIHFKLYDPNNNRYEVPIDMPPPPQTKPPEIDYKVEYSSSPFGLKVTRKSTGATLFNSINDAAQLIFADQFIQITTSLDSPYLYGIGERQGHLLVNVSSWSKFFLWAHDQAPAYDMNLYGSHPFYMNLETDGNVHGVFLLNSNAMEMVLQPDPALTFRTIGGILDFYIYSGPSPDDVVKQYVQSIGLPNFPPYWGLGFHLCRYNYGSIDRMKFINQRNRDLGIPFEVQWADIDYMDNKKIWTYDNDKFHGFPEFVRDIHGYDQKFVVIVDPGVAKSPGNYKVYDKGVKMDVFIKNDSNHILEGWVWPGLTVFPDFTHSNVTQWWYEDAKDFHDVIPYDGLWIDMNEPANFVDGSVVGCTDNNLDKPPYLPGTLHGKSLPTKTLCPSAKQYYSTHYNLHNLYGHHEAQQTHGVLEKILNNSRAFVLSRSTFVGTGKFAFHWTGDVASSWEELYNSIPAILSFQFFGIPFVGADVCGFRTNTTEELCIRWMQLGALYPFMRNHNDDTSMDQDPGAFSNEAQSIMKDALELRYSFLPFLYTQFFLSSNTGSPVIKPLFFLYPKNLETYSIDKQFVWGDCLLVTPVLNQGATKVEGYFGLDLWYDIYTGEVMEGSGSFKELDAPLGKINIHLKGGSILPRQDSAPRINLARKTPFNLLIGLDKENEAKGQLYLDDGESLDFEEKVYSVVEFQVKNKHLTNNVVMSNYEPVDKLWLGGVTVFGVEAPPSKVLANGDEVEYDYNQIYKVLSVASLHVDLLTNLNINWL